MDDDMELVYICSPYAGDIEHNEKMAREYSKYAASQGAAPVAVHLLYPQFMDDSNPADRAKACGMGLRVLSSCDACWVFGERISQGMAAEIAEAEQLGIPLKRINIIGISENESINRKDGINMAKYGVWSVRSGNSVFGHAEAWLKNDEEPYVFDTYDEASAKAEEISKSMKSINLRYYAKEIDFEISEMPDQGIKMGM